MNALEMFGHWREVRAGLFDALDKLSDAQLTFVPYPGLRSLGGVAVHIARAEENWFRRIVTCERSTRPDWQPEGYPTVAQVKALLSEVHGRTEDYLAALDVAELDHVVTSPEGGRFSLRWIIWHVLEHEIHHRGEIFLMLGLQGIEGPDI